MPRGVPNVKKPKVDPMEVGGPEDVIAGPAPLPRVGGLPHVAVAFVQALEQVVIPGMLKIGPTPRIDPLEPEWEGWRIIVAGPSVFLIAPKGWRKGIIDATGGPSENFQVYGEAHGWKDENDARQIFEIPRSRFLIRYLVADDRDNDGDFEDQAIVEAFRTRSLAAPDAAVRAIAAERVAEEKARLEAERLAEQRRAARLAPKPPPKVVARAKAAAAKKVEDDEDVGLGDEGEIDEPDEDDE